MKRLRQGDGTATAEPVRSHPFRTRPHRTLLAQSAPVLVSLIAEPLTGLADTAFVARLGAPPLAALGVATVLLSSVFWIFNFLGIGTQTAVARAVGASRPSSAAEANGLAVTLAATLGILLGVVLWPVLEGAAAWMGAAGDLRRDAVLYLRIRLFAAPAVLVTIAAFGALRGLQDMRTPFWIASAVNVLNVVLDALLIFGWGPVPALGLAGAALATTASQWLGALWALTAVRRRPGLTRPKSWREATGLLVVGGDLILRSGALLLFVVLTTRLATRIGPEAGSAHQAIRQFWVFTALLLDAFAITAQSLVGFFLGAGEIAFARRAAAVACGWGLASGAAVALAMLLARVPIARLLVPPEARDLFWPSWLAAALAIPVNAVCFVTDGVHWGTGDYRYLRNGMLFASGVGILALGAVDETRSHALLQVWIVTAGWITVRTAIGLIRIWPGVGRSPLRTGTTTSARTVGTDEESS